MADEVVERATASAESFEDFIEAEKAAKTPPAGDIAEPPASSVTEAPPAPAPASGTGEKKPPQGKNSASDRIRELNDKHKAEKERAENEKQRADRLEQELRDLRGRNPESSKPTPAQPEARTEPKATDGRPTLKEYIDKAVAAKTGESYEDVFERWQDDRDKWRDGQRTAEQRKADELKAANEVHQRIASNVADFKRDHPDYDDKVSRVAGMKDIPFNVGIDAFLKGSPVVGAVVYYLADHEQEYREIAAMSSENAFRRLVRIEDSLTPSGSAPEVTKPKPKVVARPYTPVGGTSSPPPNKPLSEATDLDEFITLQRARKER